MEIIDEFSFSTELVRRYEVLLPNNFEPIEYIPNIIKTLKKEQVCSCCVPHLLRGRNWKKTTNIPTKENRYALYLYKVINKKQSEFSYDEIISFYVKNGYMLSSMYGILLAKRASKHFFKENNLLSPDHSNKLCFGKDEKPRIPASKKGVIFLSSGTINFDGEFCLVCLKELI